MKSVDKILRLFVARYTIKWEKPKIINELNPYYSNPDVSNLFSKNDLDCKNEKDLIRFLSNGSMVSLNSEIVSKITNLSSDIDSCMMNQTFSQSFKELEHKIEKGDILLEAPILIHFKDGSYFCYSGRKRAYLALKHDIPLVAFLVKQS